LISLLICRAVLDRRFDVETCQPCSYPQEQSTSGSNFQPEPLSKKLSLNFTLSLVGTKMSLHPATCWSFSLLKHVAVSSMKPYFLKTSLAIAMPVCLTSSCLSSLDS
jgi:hypothetical protein